MSVTERDSAQREQKAKEAQREASDAIDELLWLMSDKRGRRFMWRQLSGLGVFSLSFVAGDFSLTAFNEGRRNEGLKLMAEIMEHCPERYNEMQKEAKQYERRNSK